MSKKEDMVPTQEWSDERIRAALRRPPQPPIPPGLKDRLLAQVPLHATAAPMLRLRWALGIGAATAAVAALGLTLLVHQPAAPPSVAPPDPQDVTTDIHERLEAEGRAAQLLSASQLLQRYPDMQQEATEIRRYVRQTYAGTMVVQTYQK